MGGPKGLQGSSILWETSLLRHAAHQGTFLGTSGQHLLTTLIRLITSLTSLSWLLTSQPHKASPCKAPHKPHTASHLTAHHKRHKAPHLTASHSSPQKLHAAPHLTSLRRPAKLPHVRSNKAQ
eukprot:scaffold97231_cov24-Tisochrysis_lutea.AAC.2